MPCDAHDPVPAYTVVPSPVGDVLLVMEDGALTGLYLHDHEDLPVRGGWQRDDDHLAGVVAQLGDYFAGTRTTFDVPVRLAGTPFQQRVWQALTTIPYGTTISYGELASRVGRPTASRAVGAANGRNPVSIVVPCHRVIGADGTLVGYGGGLDRKRYLLELEGSLLGL